MEPVTGAGLVVGVLVDEEPNSDGLADTEPVAGVN